MKKLIVAVALLVTACSDATIQRFEGVAPTYQAQIAQACSVAMGLAPLAPPIAPWIIGGCATEQAIAKLALDPTSLAWVNSLIAKAKPAA